MRPVTKIASILFALIMVLHLYRLIDDTEILIEGRDLPLWISFMGFIIAGLLSYGLWKESGR